MFPQPPLEALPDVPSQPLCLFLHCGDLVTCVIDALGNALAHHAFGIGELVGRMVAEVGLEQLMDLADRPVPFSSASEARGHRRRGLPHQGCQ